jgi:BolA protein
MTPRLGAIRSLLDAALDPVALDVEDESHHHAGHAGAAGGAGHFRVRVVSERFRGLSRVARHRLVYETLAPMMPHEIHALAIEARTPDEAGAVAP